MPTKKSTKSSSKKSLNKTNFDFQSMVNSSESYKSLFYGIITVVVLFVVIVLGIRTLQQNKAEIDDEALSTYKAADDIPSKYTVTEGDTLWSIAEKEYGSGFKWNEIAKANNIKDASGLTKGMELTIPELENTNQDQDIVAVSPTHIVTPSPTIEPVKNTTLSTYEKESVGAKISGNSYTVVRGDTLWDISIRAYGNGFRWTEIAKLNNLVNPNLIHSGNVFKLPRP